MSETEDEPPPSLQRSALAPYASLILLICPYEFDPAAAFVQLRDRLLKARERARSRSWTEVVATGLDGSSPAPGSADPLTQFDEYASFAYRTESWPSWLKESTYIDIRYELSIAFRKDRIIAVHIPSSMRDSFQRWLDKPPRPMLRRLLSEILENAILTGETRGLWLRGTHSPQKTLPNSKNTVGSDLRQTLSSVTDQTYALGSARALMPASPTRVSLTGSVGTTPTSSLVWNRPMETFEDFCQCADELIDLVAAELEKVDAGEELGSVFPLLTTPVRDNSGVQGAYDIACANPVDLPGDLNESKALAAMQLESTSLTVRGRSNSPHFEIAVGLSNGMGGRVQSRVNLSDGGARISFSVPSDESAPTEMTGVREALSHTDLLTIYYASGHVLSQGVLYRPNVQSHQFPNWAWKDFDGFDIKTEKPGTKDSAPQEIHDLIGAEDDKSLFAWVLREFSTGWLTCDDGSGELADFVHVADDDHLTVTFVHVKRAENRSSVRQVSAVAYALVTSQAVKNTYFMNDRILADHLRSSPVATPACWIEGKREDGRASLLDAVRERDSRSRFRVVIVQPHQTKGRYDFHHSNPQVDGSPTEDNLRLQRLENILNGGRPMITGIGADLHVYASL